MTYASHARVITVIIQTNLIHLSIKMTMLHQSGAPFVGERVFQNRGVCGQAFPYEANEILAARISFLHSGRAKNGARAKT